MDVRNQIAPKGLEFKPSSLVISDKFATILTVISYPKVIYPGFLSSLTSMSGIKVVIKHIPLPFSVITKMINKEIADSEDDLTTKKLQVKNYLEAMELQAVPLRFEQEKVLKSMLPIYPKQDIEDRIGTPIPSQ